MFVNAVSFPVRQAPSEKESTLKGKNLLQMGAISFLLAYTPFHKGAKSILIELSPFNAYQCLLTQ